MAKISILGCGWLGLPLAQKFIDKKFQVNGSTTSEVKIPVLENAGISPFLINLSADNTRGNLKLFLDSEILIIDIPPKTTGSFANAISQLVPHIEQSPVKSVLLISSISVYGETGGIVDEATNPEPDSQNGKALLESEKMLFANPNFQTTVLRFSGLIGNERHPVKHLSGRENLPNPDAPVNLIHLEDCIGIIEKIISLKKWGEIYNGVSPFHPTRKDYYLRKAKELDLKLPHFEDGGNQGKIVRAEKTIVELEYLFKQPFL